MVSKCIVSIAEVEKNLERKKGALIKGHQIWLLVVVKGQKIVNVQPFKELASCLLGRQVGCINFNKIK